MRITTNVLQNRMKVKMKWKLIKKGKKYVNRPQLEVSEWTALMILALVLDIVYLGLIIEGV